MRGNILRAFYRSLKSLKRQHKILKVVVEWWEIERELHCNAVAQFVKLRPQFVPTVVWEKSGNALKIDFKQNFLSFLIKVVWWPQISVYMWLIMSEKSHKFLFKASLKQKFPSNSNFFEINFFYAFGKWFCHFYVSPQ